MREPHWARKEPARYRVFWYSGGHQEYVRPWNQSGVMSLMFHIPRDRKKDVFFVDWLDQEGWRPVTNSTHTCPRCHTFNVIVHDHWECVGMENLQRIARTHCA